MMNTSFQEIMLNTDDTERAVLVLSDGRLMAVLSHLGAMHEDMAGMWYVEARFGDSVPQSRHIFADPQEFVEWLDEGGR